MITATTRPSLSTAPYKLSYPSFVLDNPERRYVLKIRDMPQDEKPRERLAAEGPAALSTPELLAIVLGTGTKREEVLTMSARIMKEYGEKSILTRTNAAQLAQDADIPLHKALQIVACGELGRRFFSGTSASAPVIRTAADVFEYVKDMRGLSKEHLRGLYLNGHYKVIHDEVISIGTIDANIIHPREVFRPAIEYAATAVILVHNHPSDHVEPSDADIAITKQLVQAGVFVGIELIDHIVVTKNEFRSIPVTYQQ